MKDKATSRFTFSEREPFGYRRVCAKVNLQQGVVKKAQNPELEKRIALEKR